VEIGIQTGEVPAARVGGRYQPLGKGKLTLDAIRSLLKGTSLHGKLPDESAPARRHRFELNGESYLVIVERQGDDLRVLFRRPPGGDGDAAADTRPVVPPGSAPLVALLAKGRKEGASDVHLMGDQPPRFRRVGELHPVGDTVPRDRVRALLMALLPPATRERLDQAGYVDLSLDLPEAGRIRANIGLQATGFKACFRLVPDEIPTLQSLGLPEELAAVSDYHQGLALVSGPSGHGKTTTMAALVGLVNEKKADHIITVEDPVEFVHSPKKAVVTHREVGVHTRSFGRALKGALRQDPDVIVIGELRDLETVQIALTAAETGHLVIGTIATRSGAKTISRLIDLFPPGEQAQVRATLAGALKIIVSQRLLPASSGDKMVAAAELITGSVPLWNLIRDDKLLQLPSLQQRGRSAGMIRLDESLRELVQGGQISREVALAQAEEPNQLAKRLPGA